MGFFLWWGMPLEVTLGIIMEWTWEVPFGSVRFVVGDDVVVAGHLVTKDLFSRSIGHPSGVHHRLLAIESITTCWKGPHACDWQSLHIQQSRVDPTPTGVSCPQPWICRNALGHNWIACNTLGTQGKCSPNRYKDCHLICQWWKECWWSVDNVDVVVMIAPLVVVDVDWLVGATVLVGGGQTHG